MKELLFSLGVASPFLLCGAVGIAAWFGRRKVSKYIHKPTLSIASRGKKAN